MDDDDKLVDDAVNVLEQHVTPRLEIPPEQMREMLLWAGGHPILGPTLRTALAWQELYVSEYRRHMRFGKILLAILAVQVALQLVVVLT